jgi:hypothetical protein
MCIANQTRLIYVIIGKNKQKKSKSQSHPISHIEQAFLKNEKKIKNKKSYSNTPYGLTYKMLKYKSCF